MSEAFCHGKTLLCICATSFGKNILCKKESYKKNFNLFLVSEKTSCTVYPVSGQGEFPVPGYIYPAKLLPGASLIGSVVNPDPHGS